MARHSSRRRREPFYPKERFRTSSDVLLEYIFFDRKKPITIVFINGWSLRHSSWKAQMRDREGRPCHFADCNLLVLNNRGHGDVNLGDTDPSTYLTDCAADIRELVLHLGIADLHLVAHSMGALIATEFYDACSDSLDIKSVKFVTPVVGNPLDTFPASSLVRPLLKVTDHTIGHERLVSAAKLMLGSLSNPATLRLYYFYFRAASGSKVPFKFFRKYMESIIDVDPKTFVLAFEAMVSQGDRIGEKMRKIECPVLALTGERDFLVSPHSLDILKQRIRHAVVEVLAKATHFPMSERPTLVNAFISSTL